MLAVGGGMLLSLIGLIQQYLATGAPAPGVFEASATLALSQQFWAARCLHPDTRAAPTRIGHPVLEEANLTGGEPRSATNPSTVPRLAHDGAIPDASGKNMPEGASTPSGAKSPERRSTPSDLGWPFEWIELTLPRRTLENADPSASDRSNRKPRGFGFALETAPADVA